MAKLGPHSHLARFIVVSSVTLTAWLWLGVASAGTWQAVGTGDCAGRDVAFTRGAAPEAGKCDAKFVGYTAVCWAHGCTYKSLATSACTGGANPGQMYTCAPAAPKSAPPPPPAPASVSWQPAGVGDCPGRDVAGSGGSRPDPAKCTASFAGNTAVCWASGCTYKNVATASCTGGASPGQMYTCAAPAAAPPPPAPAPVPAGPMLAPPLAPAGGNWQPVGVGDCPGRDVSGSRGPIPEPGKCEASFAGNTAVCWASGCTYKSVVTAACTGGANPGQMYTCVPPPPPAAKPKPRGKHYSIVNYTGDTKKPHEFVVDWKTCKVAELGPEFDSGAEEITVEVCRPGNRLIMKTDFRTTGTFIHYDWVMLDLGATVAGAYCDAATCGPSAGKQGK